MVLVVGSTGFLGSAICKLLSNGKKQLLALLRKDSDPVKVKQPEEFGAELVQAVLEYPETLKTTCAGIDAVISTASTL